MKHYAGIDVSLEYSSVCIVDAEGGMVQSVGRQLISTRPKATSAKMANAVRRTMAATGAVTGRLVISRPFGLVRRQVPGLPC